MPYFDKTSTGNSTPESKNVYLRSTEGCKFESYTVSALSVPEVTIDGEVRRVLQSGEAMAKITSGPEAGKVGPVQAGATDGRAEPANYVGINDTYEPWRLVPQEGRTQDVEIGVLYDGACVKGWCLERDAAGALVPLSDATADALRGARGVDILFH